MIYPEITIYNIDYQPFSRFIETLKLSKLNQFTKNIEYWTSNSSSHALGYLTHSIFRYFGKFPPPIARVLIKEYTDIGELVIDPMCGSGTTALESLLLERDCLASDINPLSVLVTKVKSTKLDGKKLSNLLEKITFEYGNKKLKKDDSIKIVGIRDPLHWFLPETIDSLNKIKTSINNLSGVPEEYKDALNVSFLATVRRVSKATTQQGRLFLDVNTAIVDALPMFKKKVINLIKIFDSFPEKNVNITVIQKDARELSKNYKKKAKLIICHPPYFNSYKYSAINSLELGWYGIDHSEIRKGEVREAFKVGKEEKLISYIDDMRDVLINLSNNLNNKGVLALMIGDTIMHNNYLSVTYQLLNDPKIFKIYSIEKIALRIPQFTEASWAASMRRSKNQIGIKICDFIIILRKNG
jgi:site-specific DNA-methyltransferase (cytosine-N4-specific)